MTRMPHPTGVVAEAEEEEEAVAAAAMDAEEIAAMVVEAVVEANADGTGEARAAARVETGPKAKDNPAVVKVAKEKTDATEAANAVAGAARAMAAREEGGHPKAEGHGVGVSGRRTGRSADRRGIPGPAAQWN